MSEERITVEVTRSGGVTGLIRRGRVDTADLDEQRAAILRSLLSEATLIGGSPMSVGRTDRFQYEVTIFRGDDRRALVADESEFSAADVRLLRWVLTEGRVVD